MMSIRYAGLCLVAALALSVVAVATASARPYGFYKDGTEEAAIKYKYKSKLTGGVVRLVTPKNGTIECTGETGSGEVISQDAAEGEIILTGCSLNGVKCNSTEPKGKEGEIIIREMTILAVLEKLTSGTEPALLFKPLKETKLECTAFQKLTITNTTGTKGGLLVLLPKAASEGNGWLGTNNEGKVFATLEFKQSGGVQEGSGEFIETEAGEIMKAGLTMEGSGLKNFKEGVALEVKLSVEFETGAVSILA
jgi:hypothetical protein